MRIDFHTERCCDSLPLSADLEVTCRVQEDLGGFRNARLRRIGARLLEAMGGQPTTCVHALAKDRNQALLSAVSSTTAGSAMVRC